MEDPFFHLHYNLVFDAELVECSMISFCMLEFEMEVILQWKSVPK